MLNLDTHILIYAMVGSLTPKERTMLSSDQWSISGIVLWELGKLAQLGRIDIDLGEREVRRYLGQIHVWPLTLEIALATQQLDFRSDPADEIIAATSIVHQIPLLTRDKKLKKSKLVPLA